MRGLISATFGLWLGIAGGALAQNGPVVVELFTSQGCSSCPAADAFFAELTQREDVIALALHVDYWDYIGWKDEFAHPAHTGRQKAYARAAGSRMLYTPQMVISGQAQISGNAPDDVLEAIRRHALRPAPVALMLQRVGQVLRITAEPRETGVGPLAVQLVRYEPQRTVEIDRGENAGRTITYHNIVTSWEVLGLWEGRAPFALDVPAPGDAPAVVLLQREGQGPIVAAAALH